VYIAATSKETKRLSSKLVRQKSVLFSVFEVAALMVINLHCDNA